MTKGKTRINCFDGTEYEFLSNFHPAQVIHNGFFYSSTEAAYQASKSLDPKVWERFATFDEPNYAKRMGQKIKCRDDWPEVKYQIMYDLVKQKFMRHPKLAKQLLDTGDAILIEGNWWHDTEWGVCNCKACGNVGQNWLGRILMMVREEVYQAQRRKVLAKKWKLSKKIVIK
jgi:hypothetical protein